jgi:hypothetical protein
MFLSPPSRSLEHSYVVARRILEKVILYHSQNCATNNAKRIRTLDSMANLSAASQGSKRHTNVVYDLAAIKADIISLLIPMKLGFQST